MLAQVKPPFRAEQIGGVLRPQALLEQRAKFARGAIDQAALTQAEDSAIKDALALQEQVGLKFATAALESKTDMKKHIEDATRFLDLDNLAISPQCGFASVDTGNPISPEVQEQKLRLVVELAKDIWGDA